jgi:hypothetical protein
MVEPNDAAKLDGRLGLLEDSAVACRKDVRGGRPTGAKGSEKAISRASA